VSTVTYRHPTAGFSVALPPGWELAEDPEPGIAMVAIEPAGRSPFRTNVVVTIEALPAGADLERWRARTESALARGLRSYVLLDVEMSERDGHGILHRLASHVREDRGPITVEQWTVIDGERALTLTASAGAARYVGLVALFAEIGSSLSTL
jgi:hypothetical protein